ncbi:DUF899 domain-containing protein [Nodosilinea sp. LEGE 07298]|uniref:DUF899 domain-containing protein n=1 Tax=Nodosilinea sp. LEGE 07298 TaxID=2777970 RepID=UPI00187F0A22|nr:DUF899 domain-containing protein [Nodosilinea sp. LEGE 07298]MBE9113018.1 DUF899 domain-containing protein [Nodosilinea sp. LEGE 07298]
MTTKTLAHPPVVSPDVWLADRKALLADEKELTKQRDRVNAKRRRLPMVKLEKTYRFDGPTGQTSLLDLFEGRRQLLVYHFMFAPEWDNGCSGCTGLVNALGDLSLLGDRDTTMVLVSRAPLAKLEDYKARHHWTLPWVSSFDSDFNHDFHVSLDASVAPVQYNYRDQANLKDEQEQHFTAGEHHGMSVFFRIDDDVFHTYSTYARGCEGLTDAYSLLDLTPYGRQEDFEESPSGWPQRPTYG